MSGMDEEASKRQPKTPKRTNKGCLPDSASEDDGPALPTNQGSEKKEEKQVVKQETNGNKDVKNEATPKKEEVKLEKEADGEMSVSEEKPKTNKKVPTRKNSVAAKKEESEESDYEKTPAKGRKSPAKRTPVKKETPKRKAAKKESSSESEAEEVEKKKTPAKGRKSPAKKTATSTRTPARKRKNDNEDEKPAKRAKKEVKEEKEENVWWEEDDQSWKVGDKKNWKWRTLSHNGIIFPPDYVPHGVKMLYNGKPVDLTDEQEELATFFARYMETDHMKKPQFSVNFFNDFKKALGKGHIIKDFDKCDFTPILEHLKKEKETKAARTKEEKEKEKKQKEAIKEKYGFAIVDGRKEQIGNYTVEPPGLFLGRGDHPKSGCLKNRIYPEHITLNLDENAPIPPCPIKGHKWGGVVHNHEVMWLAFWRQNITNTPKYVLFSATSSLRGRSDRKKFEVAQRLKSCVKKIRKAYMADLKSEDPAIMQRATAMWVIDHLALRVGNDKGKDEADTVGCCSLRCEHVKLHKPNKVEFDFLGKDSMPYRNTVEVDQLVFKNFQKMMKNKNSSDDIFHLLNPTKLNQHLSSLMPGLSAKVFRTYNASHTMQEELNKYDKKKFKNYSADQKVAILCNHQRTVSKTHADQMAKIDDQIEDAKKEIKELEKYKKALKSGKSPKKVKNEDGETPTKLPQSAEAAEKKIAKLVERIERLETRKKDKDQLKEVSTSTSKVNYIDPRVTLAWCKKVDLDPKKVFPTTLRAKFQWAIAEIENKPDFVF